ncbi:tetratricopeptide repeat protein [Nitrosomonas ureae]|uniref:Uncharacterized protein n=1 Tax=Nitrosomonas ureae TaxID=44577 RepID=A0A286ACC6_9PROT|nr:tetratricopeptide repeat protein [Nitrosomonas ureae]SOD19544.1 hypothetical protein SAMN06297164_2549 [Nitrosomonas ureae]
MSEIITLKLIESGFWLLLLSVCLLIFHKEVKRVLQSLSNFKLLGATFELRDTKESIKSYILLSETLIDLLSTNTPVESLKDLMSMNQIEKLGNFALQYTKEVSNNNWNEQLLRNITHLLIRFNRIQQAIDLSDILLANRPDFVDVLNLKALALMNSRIPSNMKNAENIFADLVERFPENSIFRFNLGLVKISLENYEDGLKLILRAIDNGHWYADQKMLLDPLLYKLRENKPNEFRALYDYLEEWKVNNNLPRNSTNISQ